MTERDGTWIILREPGCVPQRKGPFPPTMLADTLREFMEARPTAFITVLTWTSEGPLVEDGPQCLETLDGRSRSIAAKHRRSTRAAFACGHPAPPPLLIEHRAMLLAWEDRSLAETGRKVAERMAKRALGEQPQQEPKP